MPKFGSPGVQPALASQGKQSLGYKPGLDSQDPPGLFPAASPELGTSVSRGDAFPSPPHRAPSPQYHCCSSGSQQLSHGRTPKAALEFLPGSRLPPKMPFPPGMCRTRGAAVPAAALPRRRGLSCPGSPASPSCSHAPDFLPRGPPCSCRFFSRLSQHQAALRRVKGKQAGEAARSCSGESASIPAPKCSAIFFTSKKV